MTPVVVNLPSETVKAILAFMTRKQLIALCGVNHRFYSVISSPPLTKRPLHREGWLHIHRNELFGEGWWKMEINGRVLTDFPVNEGASHIELILSPQWMRFEGELR